MHGHWSDICATGLLDTVLKGTMIGKSTPAFKEGKMGKYVTMVALLVGLSNSAFARDDGRYANDPLKYWFDNLTNNNGKCCSFADGLSISEVEWDPEDGHYRVLHGESLWSSGRLALHGQQQAYLGDRKQPAHGTILSWACFGLRGDEATTAAHV